MKRLLLLSAYDAGSHQQWRLGLQAQLDEFHWTQYALPPRFFSWRVRGNSLSWAFGPEREPLRQEYDALIATSMVDLSALKGFLPTLARTPSLCYFHENQMVYPESGRERDTLGPKILNVYSALAADCVAFNSDYNRQSFLTGAETLLARMPDAVPSGIIDALAARSVVLPVPVDVPDIQNLPWPEPWRQYQAQDPNARPLLLVWAARWEFDKGPERLLALVRQLVAHKVDFRLAVLGESFRSVPEPLQQLQQHFAAWIDAFGYVESREAYLGWLRAADQYLSTALHEFQGVAAIEAVQCGCVPVLPRRLAYPEWVGELACYEVDETDVEGEAQSARQHLLGLRQRQGECVLPDVSGFRWAVMSGRYRAQLHQLQQRHARG